MSTATDHSFRLRMKEPVGAEFRVHGNRHYGEAIWLEPGKAHVVLQERLPKGHECGLTLTFPGHNLSLLATVLGTRDAPGADTGATVLHICSVTPPRTAIQDFLALLNRVNPRVAKLDTPSVNSTGRRAVRTELRQNAKSSQEHRGRKRLPPPRVAPQTIPRRVTTQKVAGLERRRVARTLDQRGLKPHELARVCFVAGPRARLELEFRDHELWHRSARWAHGWLHLVLADTFNGQVGSAYDLHLTLPHGRVCRIDVQVARKGRDRLVLEAGSLSKYVCDQLDLAFRTRG